ncbi:Tll0287-like domain-containing protein [Lutimonas sp.]|uniref:Tll0287-like domain-containing protein n=1 Tax=Lutimonas sp. TaxID=1872403 RepID=UPI003D9AFE2A
MKPSILIFLLAGIVFSCKDTVSQKEAEEKGHLIVASTAKELSENLMSKMKEGGIPLAIAYCNAEAIPITDKMSESNNVYIKRTSLKIRNPLNKPSEIEKTALTKFQTDHKNGKTLQAIVNFENEGVYYFSPILMEKKCLMCHGTPGKELSKSADSIIKSNYPDDLATGYKEGELRGMWSLSFPKN